MRIRQWLSRRLPPAARISIAQLRHRGAPFDLAATELNRHHRTIDSPVPYPQYFYGLMAAARTATAAQQESFVAIEFGVAGGNGLLAMQAHAQTVSANMGVDIEIHGFDAGAGLPASSHPLDCPFAFSGGEFAMDEAALRGRLDSSQLWIGDVADTVPDFLSTDHAPIGFVANDLDYYTSTLASFECLEVDPAHILARVTMYFDDLAGYPYTTANGEWAAIKAFNQRREQRQIGQIYGLRHQIGQYRDDWWVDSMFQLHVLDHPDFNLPEQGSVLDLTLGSEG